MLKKVITIVLMLCLIFSISVMTVAAVGEAQKGGGRGGMPPMGEMPSGDFTPPEGFTRPDGEFTPPRNSGEFTPPQTEERGSAETTDPKTNKDLTEEGQQTQVNGEDANQTQGGNQQFGDQMPGGMGGFPGNMQSAQNTETYQHTGLLGFVRTYSTPIASVVLLGLAFIFVIFYKRKNY